VTAQTYVKRDRRILKLELAYAYQPGMTQLVQPLPSKSKDAVISAEDYHQLMGNLGGEALAAAMQASATSTSHSNLAA
jgi:hypothetical protein